MITRRKTREVKIGSVTIGGDNKIAVQSMLKASPDNFDEMKEQVAALKFAGCDVVRLAVVDSDGVKAIGKLKELAAADSRYSVPLVADIHFNHKLAIESAYAGIDKIRINPGNIGEESRVKLIAEVCSAKNIPIRIGVNGGSLEPQILAKHGKPTAEALAESALYNIQLLEKYDFTNIVIAVKSSDVDQMIRTNLIIAEMCDYPMHIGVTEAGTAHMGLIKNTIGIGGLLQRGIGDTIRVSLTAAPVLEVYEGIAILKSLGLYDKSIDIISCPTCGRCRTDVIAIANEVERKLIAVEKNLKDNKKIKVAVMGCAVNGPGEAREADVGIAGGRYEFLLFKNGDVVKKIPANEAVSVLIEEVEKIIN
jgi:(E)-4-hydroxy-3-methylbut-2-enyl-diphosphate synthase